MTEKSDKLSLFDSHQVICDLKEYGVQVNLLFLRLNGCLFVWLGDEKSKLSGNRTFRNYLYPINCSLQVYLCACLHRCRQLTNIVLQFIQSPELHVIHLVNMKKICLAKSPNVLIVLYLSVLVYRMNMLLHGTI
uniref:SJCHGC09023 protein n=1 Tax=Schistosoma japonicum TaxID=6182 RepID=Q5D8F8_SCHJA|nr:SJCHGC09023 protein [Schistosoma japonicum]